MKRATMAILATAGLIVLAVVLALRYDGFTEGQLVVERAPDGTSAALVLDVERTLREAPSLAALLDSASMSGRATTRESQEVDQADSYLARLRAGLPPGGQPSVGWKEGVYLVYRQVS